jgi:hypothetical protein
MRKAYLMFCVISIVFSSCNLNNKGEDFNKGEKIPECKLDDLQQQSLVRSCKLCHNSPGLDLGEIKVSDYSHLYDIGEQKLREKIDSLKLYDKKLSILNDTKPHALLDTLSSSEIECIISYIGRYSNIQR